MPIHDWTRVEAGIFHDFHHAWIEEIKRSLNHGLLPPDYYAMAEQHAVGFGPDVLTLQNLDQEGVDHDAGSHSSHPGVLLAEPRAHIVVETDRSYYRRKQKFIAVRHASGDRIVAVIEIVSEGNKSTKRAVDAFVNKAVQLLDQDIHLMVLDLHPPGPRDPNGMHGEIWEVVACDEYHAPAGKPLTAVSYQSAVSIRAFVEPLAVGDSIPSLPLFIEPQAHVVVPLEQTYQAAYAAVPARWQRVLNPSDVN